MELVLRFNAQSLFLHHHINVVSAPMSGMSLNLFSVIGLGLCLDSDGAPPMVMLLRLIIL
jgi:hypothetical protein